MKIFHTIKSWLARKKEIIPLQFETTKYCQNVFKCSMNYHIYMSDKQIEQEIKNEIGKQFADFAWKSGLLSRVIVREPKTPTDVGYLVCSCPIYIPIENIDKYKDRS